MRMVGFHRWIAGALFLAIGAFTCNPSYAQAQLLGIEPIEPAEATENSIDWSSINLWTPAGRARTFVDPQTREALKQIDIVDRPNRPFHFYGNAVRRRNQSHRVTAPGATGPRRSGSADDSNLPTQIHR